jgi:hypothetical protein
MAQQQIGAVEEIADATDARGDLRRMRNAVLLRRHEVAVGGDVNVPEAGGSEECRVRWGSERENGPG